MPPTHAKKERDRLAKEIKAGGFMSLCAILADDEEFSALISECIDFAILNAYVFTKAQATAYREHVSESNAFVIVKSVIATYSSNQLPPPIQKLQQVFHEHVLRQNRVGCAGPATTDVRSISCDPDPTR
jgi:hypothetical protein